MIYKTKPNDFKLKFEIVSCFFEFDNKILLLKRDPNKSQGGKWGVPAGKINPNEGLLAALVREVFEETGNIISEKEFIFYKTIYVKHDYDFAYHMFNLKLDNKPEVKLSTREHDEYIWISLKDVLKLNLVDDLDKCIEMFYFSK